MQSALHASLEVPGEEGKAVRPPFAWLTTGGWVMDTHVVVRVLARGVRIGGPWPVLRDERYQRGVRIGGPWPVF